MSRFLRICFQSASNSKKYILYILFDEPWMLCIRNPPPPGANCAAELMSEPRRVGTNMWYHHKPFTRRRNSGPLLRGGPQILGDKQFWGRNFWGTNFSGANFESALRGQKTFWGRNRRNKQLCRSALFLVGAPFSAKSFLGDILFGMLNIKYWA
jgi:hypothetical protein